MRHWGRVGYRSETAGLPIFKILGRAFRAVFAWEAVGLGSRIAQTYREVARFTVREMNYLSSVAVYRCATGSIELELPFLRFYVEISIYKFTRKYF